MKKALLSAFYCEPGKGSEEGNGWNWAIGLVNEGFEVHCLTRDVNSKSIQTEVLPDNLHFHYIFMPFGTESLFYLNEASIYLYYMIWQWMAYKKGKYLHKTIAFDVAHHVTWGSLQMGSFLYKLNIPLIFGPAGGGQVAPENFKKYFSGYWASEIKRSSVSKYLIKYNPACRKMVKSASVVLASNTDTLDMAKAIGSKHCHLSFDTALPVSFFPDVFREKIPADGKLRLLWVGRFMPRKGILLEIEVMNLLKSYKGITLTIVGYGEMEEDIKTKIIEYGLEETVQMTGKVPFDTVRSYYDSHDVFFFTSLRDSCPAQLMEAMAFGMPVITVNLHGQALLVNDETGIRCTVISPELTITELRDAVLQLYNNPAKVTEMSNQAVKFARKQTWPERINNIVKQYYPH